MSKQELNTFKAVSTLFIFNFVLRFAVVVFDTSLSSVRSRVRLRNIGLRLGTGPELCTCSVRWADDTYCIAEQHPRVYDIR